GQQQGLRRWLLHQQFTTRHPYTGANPGGWAWTDLPGGVPDGDDTPGALLALANLSDWESSETQKAVTSGIDWLLSLQNRDGGWPTFCRGWGRLPFDRSGVDLTAHALRALAAWGRTQATFLTPRRERRIASSIKQGLAYLAGEQRPNGSWVPLW